MPRDWHDVRYFYPPDHALPRIISGYINSIDDWDEDEINASDTDSEPASWYTGDDQSNDDENVNADEATDVIV
ncbi:hypothetical protein IFR04_007525 [Cadophora malorum]|uniref:Uncharacterized protein n=1 Tax=Cadophora malorum TaxID=108018 RepID=A0A8H7TGW2_9HELO|nr:hypothetical protein IFR04_007525 [Cadophora malorum]